MGDVTRARIELEGEFLWLVKEYDLTEDEQVYLLLQILYALYIQRLAGKALH